MLCINVILYWLECYSSHFKKWFEQGTSMYDGSKQWLVYILKIKSICRYIKIFGLRKEVEKLRQRAFR